MKKQDRKTQKSSKDLFTRKTLVSGIALVISSFANTYATAEIEEIIVTASHREQAVQDIPYSISAVTAEDLEKSGINDISGLTRQISGLVWNDMGARSNGVNNPIVLRGLNGTSVGSNNKSPGAGDQTVSVYLNDTPLFANLRLRDVERVEVLRGPQGTLYGSGSVGGTVRFIYAKPDFTETYGRLDTSMGSVADAEDLNYSADGIFNLPLSENLALRISAGYEKKPGVIDAVNLMVKDSNGNPVLADPNDFFGSDALYKTKKDVDESDVSYIRASMLWAPTEETDVLLSLHIQEDSAEDYSGQSLHAGEREHTRFRTSPIEITNSIYALEVTSDLGFATITSSTSYTDTDMDSETDNTNYGLRARNWYPGGNPRPSYTDGIDYETDRFTQELRLSSNDNDSKFEWIVGAYYSDYQQKSYIRSDYAGWEQYVTTPGHPSAVEAFSDPNATLADRYVSIWGTPSFANDWVFTLDKDIPYTSKSIFGEWTTNLTDAWQFTLGARKFWLDNKRSSALNYPYAGTAYGFEVTTESKDDDTILKFNTSYDLHESHKIYFTAAEGYRQGGSNALPPFTSGIDDFIEYDPDFSTNWEVGAKGSIGDSTTYSAAVYYIEWENIQLQIPAPGTGIPTIANGGDAVSRGIELETRMYISENFDVLIGFTSTQAELTTDSELRSGYNAYDGDQLPGVPDRTFTLSMNYSQPAFDGEITYHLDGSYRSETQTALNKSYSNYYELSGFGMWNASATWGNETYKAGLYISNITDELGITSVDLSNDASDLTRPGSLLYLRQPRTIGINLGVSF